MTFVVGQELQLTYSTGLSPSHFSCHLHANTKLLQTLMADIDFTVSSVSMDHPTILSPSESILAQYSADEHWYRAQVVSFDPAAGSAEVLFVDYGNCDSVPLTSVRRTLSPYQSNQSHAP